jgi:glycosyltransferase involved in cell wall biosynthesis
MKFTIFTPFHEYIECAEHIYESLLKQTYIHWEWLICDDFSESVEVINKLKYLESLDDRVKIIYPEYKNQYLFNLPVNHANGDIMVVIDSDDIPYPKLLEVYKEILEKFPNLSLLGCSSIMKDLVFSGESVGAKYINYKNSINYLDADKNGINSIIGDARAFRVSKMPNNGVFTEEIYKDFVGVDIQKALRMEELGDIISIPRSLYNYTRRYDSMSGGINMNKYRENNQKILTKLIEDANNRVNRENLISINNYFDESFRASKNFYFSNIDTDGTPKVIEYWDKKISYREKHKLDELYFDHKIYYNTKLKNPNKIIISIEDNNEFDLLDVFENRNLLNCDVIITSNLENKETVLQIIESKGRIFWFNIFYYLTITFKI